MLAGGTSKPKVLDNPAPEWISTRSWNDILTTGTLANYIEFSVDFKNHLDGYKRIFDSMEPHRYSLFQNMYNR